MGKWCQSVNEGLGRCVETYIPSEACPAPIPLRKGIASPCTCISDKVSAYCCVRKRIHSSAMSLDRHRASSTLTSSCWCCKPIAPYRWNVSSMPCWSKQNAGLLLWHCSSRKISPAKSIPLSSYAALSAGRDPAEYLLAVEICVPYYFHTNIFRKLSAENTLDEQGFTNNTLGMWVHCDCSKWHFCVTAYCDVVAVRFNWNEVKLQSNIRYNVFKTFI